ncbi:MAG: hypothetical protein U5L10_01325 [Candidatus Moranbacteria bacterium]|nr:hypothetical protein [Candidatus Moranbacteria bacterium]
MKKRVKFFLYLLAAVVALSLGVAFYMYKSDPIKNQGDSPLLKEPSKQERERADSEFSISYMYGQISQNKEKEMTVNADLKNAQKNRYKLIKPENKNGETDTEKRTEEEFKEGDWVIAYFEDFVTLSDLNTKEYLEPSRIEKAQKPGNENDASLQ